MILKKRKTNLGENMWIAITNFFIKIFDKIPVQLKKSALDRESPNYCDCCQRMSMVLIHTGKSKITMFKGKPSTTYYHGLYYCKCGKLKAIKVPPQKMAPPALFIKLVKELKEQKVIVDKTDGIVTYSPELYRHP